MEICHSVPGGAFTVLPSGTPVTPEMAAWWEKQYRRLMTGLAHELELFGQEYQKGYSKPKKDTVRSNTVGRFNRWASKKLLYDSIDGFYEVLGLRPVDKSKRGTWQQKLRDGAKLMLSDVFGIEFNPWDNKNNIAFGDSYLLALFLNILIPLAKLHRQITTVLFGKTYFSRDDKGKVMRDKTEYSVANQISNYMEKRKVGNLYELNKKKVKDTVFNIDLDAFSATQQGAIMRILSGEDKVLKENNGALPKDVLDMLDVITNQPNCGVILTCNSPQSIGICAANAKKLHLGRLAINANNGAFLAVAGADGMLHVVNDDRIDKSVMSSIADFFEPGIAGPASGVPTGALGGDNTKLFVDTPVKVTLTDQTGAPKDVDIKFNWEMVIVDDKGKKHVVPVVGPKADPDDIAEATSKLTKLDKDKCQSITFRPTKESLDLNANPDILKVIGNRALSTEECEEIIWRAAQAGATAFLTTCVAEKNQLDTRRFGSTTDLMEDMQISLRSDGGFDLVTNNPRTGKGHSSYEGAREAATKFGFDPDKELCNLMYTYEFGGTPMPISGFSSFTSKLKIPDATRAMFVYQYLMNHQLIAGSTDFNYDLLVRDVVRPDPADPTKTITVPNVSNKFYYMGNNSLMKQSLHNYLMANVYNKRRIKKVDRNKVLKRNLINGSKAMGKAVTNQMNRK